MFNKDFKDILIEVQVGELTMNKTYNMFNKDFKDILTEVQVGELTMNKT